MARYNPRAARDLAALKANGKQPSPDQVNRFDILVYENADDGDDQAINFYGAFQAQVGAAGELMIAIGDPRHPVVDCFGPGSWARYMAEPATDD